MMCACCKLQVFSTDEIIQEKAGTWKEAVYPYELTVCDKTCWCYSATNPQEDRFDVVRVLPSAAGLCIRGIPTTAHSWFSGYAWQLAQCNVCGSLLGWAFSGWSGEKHDPHQCQDTGSSWCRCSVIKSIFSKFECQVKPQPAFFGLILTRLRENSAAKR